MEIAVKEKSSDLSKSKKLKNRSMDFVLMDSDANILYTTSVADCESINPKLKSGYALTKEMIHDSVKTSRKPKFHRK